MSDRLMTREEIRSKIAGFDRWHYEFDLGGEKTPIADPTRVNRHRQRKRYFFEPMVHLFGGSLAGKRVLDLGCNAGYWSLSAIEAGAESVLGVDGRQMHIDQANLVFGVKGIDPDRYNFEVANIYDFDFARFGPFDIVLNLGLMYHISKHVELMEKISEVNSDFMVVDTGLARVPGSYLKVRYENVESPRNAVDYELVMSPTQKAVHDIAGQFGYSVVTLKPEFTDWTGSREYRYGRRRAFFCAKETDLSNLRVPTEPVRTRIQWQDVSWAAQKYATLGRKKIGR